jgi:plasmid stabilization system protein ParE
MRVDWTFTSRDDIDSIASGRAEWSDESANHLRAAIFNRAEQVSQFPNSGRIIPEFQMGHLREVLEQGYRIMYEVFEDRIEVFGVVSSRKDVFPDL